MTMRDEIEALLAAEASQRFQLVETNVYNDGRPPEERCRETLDGEEIRRRGIYFDRVFEGYALYSKSCAWGILIGTVSRLPE